MQPDTEVPESTGKAKVVRKKAMGDWRHWFTESDVEFFKSAYLPYMALVGINCEDWTLSSRPVIEPEYSSAYMQRLTQRVAKDTARRFKEMTRRWFKKAG